jgi:transcriptional regulator with XRE-family HTH domain
MSIIQSTDANVLARRIRQAREAIGLPQDKLGVLIGLDEGCSSARISRYESGKHQPPLKTVQLLASKLGVPTAYLFCEDDLLADAILKLAQLSKSKLAQQIKNIDQLLEK